MKTKNLTIFFVILTLLAQFIFTTPVLADDDTPPPAPTEEVEETQPPIEEPDVVPSPAELMATEEPTVVTVVESTPAELFVIETPATEDPGSSESIENETPISEELLPLAPLQDLPADTSIVILNENGEVLPLATQEAAEVMAVADPMWCPASATTVTAACVNAATITALLPLLTTKNENGIIYFSATYFTNDVTFNGENLSIDQLGDNALTIQGGWNGNATPGSAITLSGDSVFSVPAQFFNWNGTVSIKNITINTAAPNALLVTSTFGSSIPASNNIVISDSIFHNSAGDGVHMNTTGTVEIKNSEFSNNSINGLTVFNSANVEISGSTFDDNFLGASIKYVGDVNIDNSQFDNNILDGMYIEAFGNVTTLNSEFSNNSIGSPVYSGLAISGAANVTIATSNFNGNGHGAWLREVDNIDIKGGNFSDNRNVGLYIYSEGNTNLEDIKVLNSINSLNNIKAGAFIDNTRGNGYVNITGTNIFNGNANDGLLILSYGDIALNNITASGNGGNGVFLFTSGSATVINANLSSQEDFFGLDASAVCGTLAINSLSGIYNAPVSGIHIYTYPDGYVQHSAPISIDCAPQVYIDGKLVGESVFIDIAPAVLPSVGSRIEFELSCADRSNYFATLPNEDKIQIVCPVSGKAIIKRLNNTALPGDLPIGYTYTSAFSLDILQSGKSISYISEGGRVNVSFDVPNLEEGTTYTLLYWDNGTWLPLKDFMLDANGNPREFNLHPNDPRIVLSGLKLVFEDGTPRLELSTNFPGIFVLVQR